MHRVLAVQLRMLCQGMGDVWDEYLSTAAFGMRTSYLGTTPLHVVFGKLPRLAEVAHGRVCVKGVCLGHRGRPQMVRDWQNRMGERLRQIHAVVQPHITHGATRHGGTVFGRINDKQGRVDVSFELGTQVTVVTTSRRSLGQVTEHMEASEEARGKKKVAPSIVVGGGTTVDYGRSLELQAPAYPAFNLLKGAVPTDGPALMRNRQARLQDEDRNGPLFPVLDNGHPGFETVTFQP